MQGLTNEMYVRDISKKVRSSHRLRGNAGEPLSQPPYGYMKSPENKKKWIINPEAATIVKNIFKMCLDGKSSETIAWLLQERKVLVPMAYWQSKGLPRGGKKTQPNPYRWCKTTVQKILTQQEYCGDCHSKLWYHTNTVNKEIHYFSCSNYAKDYRGTCPTRHYIRADAIEQVVMLEIRHLAEFLLDDEESFVQILSDKTNGDIQRRQKYLKDGIDKAAARNEKISGLYEKLFKDHAENKVSEEWFMHMSQKYETERLELKNRISRLRRELAEADEMKHEQEAFVKAVRRFLSVQALTRPLLQELINCIDVFETEGVGKSRTQRILIYYRFVGYIEMPAAPLRESYTGDTRKGVAVSYLTDRQTA